MTIPGPAYRIQTRRLVLRCWEPADAPLAKEAVDQNLDHLRPWMPWAHREPQDLQEKIVLMRRFRGAFDLGQDFTYGIFNRDETQVRGGTGLHPRAGTNTREIGYWIHKDHINQGLATEVSTALIKVAFEVDRVRRVEIRCDPRNTRSAAIPRKLGFTHEGTYRQQLQVAEGEFKDSMVWSLLAEEYPNSPAISAEIEAFDVLGRCII